MMTRVAAAFPVLRALHPAHFGAHGAKALRPDIGPRQRGEQQHQRQPRHPETGDGMQIAQRHAPAQPQPRPHDPGEPAPARPPQIQPGQDHHDRPARRQLDDDPARAPDQQTAVNLRQPRRNPVVGIGTADHLAPRRHCNVAHPAGRKPDVNDRRIARCLRHAVIMKTRAGKGGQRRLHLRIGIDPLGGRQVAPRAFLPPVELRLEQIGRPRHRQHEDEGDDEQPGIKMPAPDRAIERNPVDVGHPLSFRLEARANAGGHRAALDRIIDCRARAGVAVITALISPIAFLPVMLRTSTKASIPSAIRAPPVTPSKA